MYCYSQYITFRCGIYFQSFHLIHMGQNIGYKGKSPQAADNRLRDDLRSLSLRLTHAIKDLKMRKDGTRRWDIALALKEKRVGLELDLFKLNWPTHNFTSDDSRIGHV
jgi:hypothetical protein